MKVFGPGVRPDIRPDVRRISRPKTLCLGCFSVIPQTGLLQNRRFVSSRCLASLPGSQPLLAVLTFFGLLRPFPEGMNSTKELQRTQEKGLLFPQVPSDLLKPPL